MRHSETEAEENLLFWEIILDLWVILKAAAPSHNRIWGIVLGCKKSMTRKFMPPEKKGSHRICFLDSTRGIKETVPLTCKESLTCPAKKRLLIVSQNTGFWLAVKNVITMLFVILISFPNIWQTKLNKSNWPLNF